MIKTVLITGASRGIGRASLLEMARRGYNVIGVCLTHKEELEAAAEEARAFGVNVLAISGTDVGSYKECREKIYNTIKEIGVMPDCIVNNAGISYVGILQEMDIEEWNRIISVNLTSVFNMSKLFIPDMIRKGCGKIINISSVWGSAGASCEAAYSASKGGMNALTKALAKELAPSNIQVNAVAFGTIDTEMNSFLTREDRVSLEEEIPSGRFGYVEEAAKMVADVTELPAYVTGQIITMDGGWL